jgi:WD40 repeat protein
VLTLDALQFIQAFAPIISKAAMQTYYSALVLMPSASLLFKKYSAMSQPSLKSLELSYLRIIDHPQVMLPECLYRSTSSDDIIALSRPGGIVFFDTRSGNEIGSRIATPDRCHYLFAFSPDGKWIAIQGDNRLALEIWDVKTCTCVKTIETKSKDIFERITYSADGEKVMAIAKSAHSLIPHRLVFILDVKTDKPLKQLEVEAFYVAISSNGSQIAIKDMLGIKTIDVSTGHIGQEIPLYNDTDPRIVWSPNGQFLAFASKKQNRIGIYIS